MPAIATKPPIQTLREVFGYHEFRPHQAEIIEGLIAGHDAFVLMPTGGGKSLCFQIPAMLRQGVGIVVSPLISLMKDQVDSLRANGVRAAFYNSSMAPAEARGVLTSLRAGELDLLYVAPERLMTDDFLGILAEAEVALFAIDEAHCVSQWGHDFRPEYIQLGRLREHFPSVPMIALTATADPQTREDILVRLGLTNAKVYVTGFDRPNIRYSVQQKTSNPLGQLLQLMKFLDGESAIVYCLSRKRVEKVAESLRSHGINAEAYHAGMTSDQRSKIQEAFIRDDLRVVVATVAFGMGIDKPNVRAVAHYDMPKNIEGYYQETGRAGRDGLPSEAVLLFGAGDIVFLRKMIQDNANPVQRKIELAKLDSMMTFVRATSCRRRVLLEYFGELRDTDCGNCDLCDRPVEEYDATEDAFNALMAIYQVRQRSAVGHVVDVLKGNANDRVRMLGHDKLSTFGAGADKTRDHWSGVLRQLIDGGYLRQDEENYNSLKLTPLTGPIMRKEAGIRLAVPQFTAKAERKARRERPKSNAADEPLFQELRALRKRLADEQGVPPYVVFGDATLRDMAARRPQRKGAMLEVSGVGHRKLEQYGELFLQVIRDFDEGV